MMSIKRSGGWTVATVMGLAVVVMGSTRTDAAATSIYPNNSTVDTAAPLGVVGDGAPGFGNDSFAANGTDKTAIILTAERLFGTDEVTVGDLESLSYWTKQDVPETETPVNWYVEIYTATDGVNDDSWYGRRLNLEPYFADNRNEPDDQWVQWSTDGTSNKLRIFDANRGASDPVYGTFNDPFLDALTDGEVNWSDYYASYENAVVDYRDEVITHIGISTGSGWADVFYGQVDGFSITWDSDAGSLTSTVNFEVPEPASLALLGLGGGMMLLRRRVRG